MFFVTRGIICFRKRTWNSNHLIAKHYWPPSIQPNFLKNPMAYNPGFDSDGHIQLHKSP